MKNLINNILIKMFNISSVDMQTTLMVYQTAYWVDLLNI